MKNYFIKYLRLFMPIIIGSIIGYLTRQDMDNFIIKPLLYPPKILFPIIWSIIYLLIGLSYTLYREKYNDKKITISYYINLFLNFTWPIIYFTLNLRLLSIFWIIILFISTIILMIQYYKKSKISTYLLIPYMFWLIFATYLAISIYIIN